jgi:hypothetical protein
MAVTDAVTLYLNSAQQLTYWTLVIYISHVIASSRALKLRIRAKMLPYPICQVFSMAADKCVSLFYQTSTNAPVILASMEERARIMSTRTCVDVLRDMVDGSVKQVNKGRF